jgi:hypothetical protein
MHRLWFRLEAAGALAALFLATLTLVVPDWLEAFGFDPDWHSGETEWLIALALAALSAELAALAYRDWHRLRAAAR